MISKVSELKVKLSTHGTQLNFGAQELFIQQLQDEISRLNKVNQQFMIKARQQHHQILREKQYSKSDEVEFNEKEITGYTDSKELQKVKSKLKSAAKFITHLIQEKEHLIEMSNQLRGELNRMKCKFIINKILT